MQEYLENDTIKNEFKVLPTNTPHRKYAEGDYVISIRKKQRKELKIGMFAIVGYCVNYQGSEDSKSRLTEKGIPLQQEMRIHARVIGVDKKSNLEMRMEMDEIRIDQTIRNAIGIPYSYEHEKVRIYPVKMVWYKYWFYIIRYFITRFLGFRYLFYRACSAHIHDMEKSIIRIPKDTFPILGTNIENKIVLESPVERKDLPGFYEIRTMSLTAHELTDEIKNLRIKMEKGPEIRYRNPLKWISVEPDISRIFIDKANRERLGLDQLYPVKARRDLIDLLKSQILGVGLFFFVSMLSIGRLVPLDKNWINFILILLLGIVASLFLMFIILRSKVK